MARKTRLEQKTEQPAPGPVRELRPHPTVWAAALNQAGGDPKRLRTVADPEAPDGVTIVILPDSIN